jgi:hypothetical protein
MSAPYYLLTFVSCRICYFHQLISAIHWVSTHFCHPLSFNSISCHILNCNTHSSCHIQLSHPPAVNAISSDSTVPSISLHIRQMSHTSVTVYQIFISDYIDQFSFPSALTFIRSHMQLSAFISISCHFHQVSHPSAVTFMSCHIHQLFFAAMSMSMSMSMSNCAQRSREMRDFKRN